MNIEGKAMESPDHWQRRMSNSCELGRIMGIDSANLRSFAVLRSGSHGGIWFQDGLFPSTINSFGEYH
jgi:hypothetical protein